MKKITFFLVLIIAISCQAQLLWKVSGPGLEKPSYLFGTYHLMPSTFVDSVPGLNKAIESADEVWVEIENEKMKSPEVLTQMSALMTAPADSTIDRLISPDGYKIVDTVVRRYLGMFGVTLDQVKMMRPAALSLQLEQLMAMKKLPNSDFSHLLDGEVERRVKALGKPSHSLESVDFQIQLFFGSPLQKQAADLLEMCKNIDEVERNFDDIHQAYVTQDFDKLTAAITNPVTMDEEDLATVCFERNEKWLPTLIDAAKKGSIIVAVGAAHLVLERGLITLLRLQGYTVEPVK